MKMTWIEKRLVNREQKAARNIELVERHLTEVADRGVREVLELGCGIGTVSARLAQKHNLSVCATDFDPAQIDLARRLYPEADRLRFEVADAADLRFPNASFDLVLSQNVFHHIPNWEEATREIARVLRPGGVLLWYDLSFPSLVSRVLRPLLRCYGLYTLGEATTAFRAAGFTTEQQDHLAHGPFGHHDLVLTLR